MFHVLHASPHAFGRSKWREPENKLLLIEITSLLWGSIRAN